MSQLVTAECAARMETFRRAHPEHSSLSRGRFTLTLDGWQMFFQENPACLPVGYDLNKPPEMPAAPPASPPPVSPAPRTDPTTPHTPPIVETSFGPCGQKLSDFIRKNPQLAMIDTSRGMPFTTLNMQGWQAFYTTHPECAQAPWQGLFDQFVRTNAPVRSDFAYIGPTGIGIAYLPAYDAFLQLYPYYAADSSFLAARAQAPLPPQPPSSAAVAPKSSSDATLWKYGAIAAVAILLAYSLRDR